MKDKVFMAILEAETAHWEQARKGFQSLNLTDAQPKVLYVMRVMEGCVQKELAEVCEIKPSSMTVLLERMVKAGYIRKEETKVSGGKRAYRIFFTEMGRTLSDQIDVIIEDLERKSLKGFSEEEREQFFSLLGRVSDNLRMEK